MLLESICQVMLQHPNVNRCGAFGSSGEFLLGQHTLGQAGGDTLVYVLEYMHLVYIYVQFEKWHLKSSQIEAPREKALVFSLHHV